MAIRPLSANHMGNPTDKTVTVQANVDMAVKAFGMPPLFYQWFFDGTSIDGATNATLTIITFNSRKQVLTPSQFQRVRGHQ